MKYGFKLLSTLLTLSLLTCPVLASQQSGARVLYFNSIQGLAPEDRYTYFTLEDNGTRPATGNLIPSCAGGGTYKHWVINTLDKDIAKQQIAIVMMAKAQGKVLNVTGTDNCIEGPNGYNHQGEVVVKVWIGNN